MILHIALKDLKVIFRDRKALAIMLIMPAVLMLILGSALGPMFEGNLAIDRFSIAVVDKDGGQAAQIFYQNMLRDNMSDMFETYVVNEEQAEEMLRNKTVPSIIIIPENFSKNISDNLPVELEVRSQVDDRFKTIIVESVSKGFANGFSQSYAVAGAVEEVFAENGVKIDKFLSSMSNRDALMMELGEKLGKGLIAFNEDVQERNRTVTGMQYYCAAMLVMFILFGASMGIRHMAEERETRTLSRLLSTRADKGKVITGKFLGLLLITLAQAITLIVFTHFVYRVDWGSSILGILIVTLSCTFAASGLGMMIAAIAKTTKSAEGISQLVVQLFTILGGGMVPIYVMPSAVKALAKGTLNWWAVNGYFDLMLGEGILTVLPYCGVMILMGIIYLGVGTWRFRT